MFIFLLKYSLRQYLCIRHLGQGTKQAFLKLQGLKILILILKNQK